MRRFSSLVEVVKVVAIVFLSAIVIRTFVFQPFVVEGSSMEGNFHNGEYLFIEKISYKLKVPKRGDVIVFRYPRDVRYNYIKRVIGLPGETIQIKNGHVYVAGELLKEDYLKNDEGTFVDNNRDLDYEVTLEKGQYFVMGDNRGHSSDSREWGPLDERFVIGRSALVLYPHASFRAIASPTYR
ncbi:MAG: signal peptidase I [Candidatus Berkelbacteria bacterium]|nr:MAG: signal peptidase I [Candidatus Berkelbacteria bacterium]QQG52003.1 MAG: signal peptidase I [Candidatus Berkelbacteria bacterium]